MRKTGALTLIFLIIAMVTACSGNPPTNPPSEPSSAVSSENQSSGQEPASDKPPRILLPEELLSAEEAADFIGCPVEIGTISLAEIQGTGSATQRYQYDLPKEIDYYQSTILALFDITQNGLISAEELAAGHDAKWSYELTKKMVENEIEGIPGLGEDGFYVKATSQVHFLFGDYYVAIAFINTKEQYSEAEDLALNKRIAAHVADALSLSDVALN